MEMVPYELVNSTYNVFYQLTVPETELTFNPYFTAIFIYSIYFCFYFQRFTQYLASSNSSFQLSHFLDKSGVQGVYIHKCLQNQLQFLSLHGICVTTIAHVTF